MATPNVLPSPRRALAQRADSFISKPGDQKINQRFEDRQSKVEVPDSYLDPLADLVKRRFEDARRVRSMQRLGNTTVDETLWRCWRQAASEDDPCAGLTDEVDLNLNMTALKVEAWQAWARTVVADRSEMPFTITPTEKPSLSAQARMEVLRTVKRQVFDTAQPAPDDLTELVRLAKATQLSLEKEKARTAAARMESLMLDQAQEGGFKQALSAFTWDFGLYPYAVISGPIPTVHRRIEWDGNKLNPVTRLLLQWSRLSPFDLFWSGDSPDTQRGSFIVIRGRKSRYELMMAAQARSYIPKNVMAALEHFSRHDTALDWLNPNPEKRTNSLWEHGYEVEELTMYGLFSGRELKPYGLQVDDATFYEAMVKVMGPYTIACHINRNPNPFARPVHAASMTKIGDMIPGRAIGQKIRDIERGYHAALRGMIKNNHYASGPMGEVDFSRIARWIEADSVGIMDPLTIMPVEPDIAGGGRPAHYFHNVPSIAMQAIQVMEFFERVADRHTQIPAAFHGEAVGTGVNRTFRGVTLLQGNALKGVQSALTNMGEGAITPMAVSHYRYNMMYSKDWSVKGDAQAVAKDIAGLLEREIKKQQSQETLMLVNQIAQTGQALPPGVQGYVANEALLAAGVDLDRFARMENEGGHLSGQPAGAAGEGPAAPANQSPGMGPPVADVPI